MFIITQLALNSHVLYFFTWRLLLKISHIYLFIFKVIFGDFLKHLFAIKMQRLIFLSLYPLFNHHLLRACCCCYIFLFLSFSLTPPQNTHLLEYSSLKPVWKKISSRRECNIKINVNFDSQERKGQ